MTGSRVREMVLNTLAWLVLLVAAQKFFPRFGPIYHLLLIVPFAALERRLDRIPASRGGRPKVAVLAYAYIFAGASLLWYDDDDAVLPWAVCTSGAVAIAAYGALGRRYHGLLGLVAVLLVPLMSVGLEAPPNPLVLEDSPARDGRFPLWFVALWIWSPTPVPVGVVLSVLTGLYWISECYDAVRSDARAL